VLSNLTRDPLHVVGFPCKHIEVRFDEVNERAFLFRIERCPDTESMAIVKDNASLMSLVGSKEQAARLDDSEDQERPSGRWMTAPQ
jgi:hypothetical protein